ncbi:MAG: hypothetical protein HYY17_07340 [Planctomycetes bacterium]|nr:hypothetical protein [Planctomycetota bacterium]
MRSARIGSVALLSVFLDACGATPPSLPALPDKYEVEVALLSFSPHAGPPNSVLLTAAEPLDPRHATLLEFSQAIVGDEGEEASILAHGRDVFSPRWERKPVWASGADGIEVQVGREPQRVERKRSTTSSRSGEGVRTDRQEPETIVIDQRKSGSEADLGRVGMRGYDTLTVWINTPDLAGASGSVTLNLEAGRTGQWYLFGDQERLFVWASPSDAGMRIRQEKKTSYLLLIRVSAVVR